METALDSIGVKATVNGNRLKIVGTVANNLTRVFFFYSPDPANIGTASILSVTQAGILQTTTITPEWSFVKLQVNNQ